MRRALAEILYLLKKREFSKNKIKFLVFTGTAGKTLTRNAVSHALSRLGFKVESMPYGYTNEIGIILSSMGISRFSFLKPFCWHQYLKAKIDKEKFVCVEIGADFRKDVKWFLSKFKPHSVFVTAISEEFWAREIKEILLEKQILIKNIQPGGWAFCNIDNPLLKSYFSHFFNLNFFEKISLKDKKAEIYLNKWSQNAYNLPVTKWKDNKEYLSLIVHGKEVEIFFNQPLFEPQISALLAALGFIDCLFNKQLDSEKLKKIFEGYSFTENRLQIQWARNGAVIIDDSYKSIPFCVSYCLRLLKKIKANKKIIVFTELRPQPKNREKFYTLLGEKMNFIDEIYFLGSQCYFNLLRKKNSKIIKIDEENLEKISKDILSHSSVNDIIFLKGTYRSSLQKFKEFLL